MTCGPPRSLRRRLGRAVAAAAGACLLSHAPSSAERYAHGANIGWVDTTPGAAAGLAIGSTFLAGRIYSANCGWIDLGDGSPADGASYSNSSAADFGVNHAAGALSGFAYGANIGWINFGWANGNDPNRPFLDLVTGAASGYVWGANVGWISLQDLLVPGVAPAVSRDRGLGPVTAGSAFGLFVTATRHEQLRFQWQRDGVPIPEATGDTLRFPSVQRFHAGDYTVVITRADSSTLMVGGESLVVAAPAPSSSRLTNLSTRAVSLTGADVLIPGFVIEGNATKRLLLRVVGPTLGGFGVEGYLDNPRLTLKRSDDAGTVEVAANDDWASSPDAGDIAALSGALGAFDLDPGSADAVVVADVSPGAYTIVADGVDGSTGIALVELYDADSGQPPSGVVNISARSFVGIGAQAPIPGFVISGDGPRTVLVRAVGPALADYGVQGALPDPRLTVFSGDIQLFGNDDWGSEADAEETAAAAGLVGAFELPDGSKDAAMVVTLAPGAYTMVVDDAAGATGIALVEVYLVP